MGDESFLKRPSERPSPFAVSARVGTASESARPLYRRIGQRIFEVLTRALCRVCCPVRITGKENFPATPYLICANHASHMDTIAILIATGEPFSRFAILAAKDYFFATELRRAGFGSLLNLIPLERTASPSSTLRTVTACRGFLHQNDGAGLIIFPEGTRSVTDTVAPFRRGSALFPMRLGLPLVPVWIGGTRLIMPKGRLMPRLGQISVHIGKPLGQKTGNSVMLEARRQIVAMQESADA